MSIYQQLILTLASMFSHFANPYDRQYIKLCFNSSPYTICGSSINTEYKFAEREYGPNIDGFMAAEGLDLAFSTSNEAHGLASGTSFVAPQIAAVLAIYIGAEGITSNVPELYERLKANAIPGIITGIPAGSNTPNIVFNTGFENPQRQDWQPYGHFQYVGGVLRPMVKRAVEKLVGPRGFLRRGEMEL